MSGWRPEDLAGPHGETEPPLGRPYPALEPELPPRRPGLDPEPGPRRSGLEPELAPRSPRPGLEPPWDPPHGAGGWTAGTSERCPFDLCDGSGFLYEEATNTAYDCRCRPQRQAWAKARSLSAVIPRRYRDVSFDRPPVTEIEPAIVAATRRFASRIDEHLDAGRGLWLMGPVGTGKTTLAMLVSKAALSAGRSVAIYSLPRLLNEIRDTHRADRSHVALLDRLIAVDLLHIDDIGAERSNDWVLEELYSIVNGRYEDQRSMVITTNILDREALCEQITARTVSRLTEMCDELPLLGHDHRMDLETA